MSTTDTLIVFGPLLALVAGMVIVFGLAFYRDVMNG